MRIEVTQNHTEEFLRDQFAMAALSGMFAADTSESVISAKEKARQAYEAADAMMKARGKK